MTCTSRKEWKRWCKKTSSRRNPSADGDTAPRSRTKVRVLFPKSRLHVSSPSLTSTAVIKRRLKGDTAHITNALFGPSTPDCLLIHITKYTYTRRLETEPLFYPSQAVFGRSAGRSTASSGTETTLTVGFPSFFLSLVGGLLRPRRGGGGTCARWRGARGRCTPGAGTRLGSWGWGVW